MGDRGKGLEFLVGGHALVVPAALVTRVVEVDLSPPPPLSRAWIGGLGVGEGDVLVAVDLAARAPRPEAGIAPGLAVCAILDTGRRTGFQWALRVSRTIGFVETTPCARPSSFPAEWPAWVTGARLGSDDVVGLLDVAAMAKAYEA